MSSTDKKDAQIANLDLLVKELQKSNVDINVFKSEALDVNEKLKLT